MVRGGFFLIRADLQGKPPPPKVKGKKVKGKGPGVFEVYIGGKARRLANPEIPLVVIAIGKKNKPVYQKAAPLFLN